uniref:TrbC/VirB2 family protein n=1 Tax=Sipha flava TaxID=143950 RepID=A0A2S2R917_9HEMI
MSAVIKFFNILVVVLLLSFSTVASAASGDSAETTGDATADVICNIIGYIWAIGGPVMTVVIIGAALLAIFGRMPWPALVALGIFCGVFFGAKAIVEKIVPASNKQMLDKCANTKVTQTNTGG